MMKSICASLITKKGVSSVAVTCDGRLVEKSVKKITEKSYLDSSYLCLIDTFIKSLRLVKKYVSENSDVENVVFEVNNSTFIKWVYNNYSKEQYQDLFAEALTLLNDIPVKYSFSYNKKPLALVYLNAGVDKVKVSGLLD